VDVLYLGIKLGIYPCLIFMGVGAMTDFGPLIANPKSLLLGAAAQLGIFLPQRGHLPFTGKQTGLIAQNFRTGRCQLSVHLLQLGTHRLGRLCRSLCCGRLGTALPRTIVLLPALRHGVPPIHPIRLIRL
jgi:hypothetical protein